MMKKYAQYIIFAVVAAAILWFGASYSKHMQEQSQADQAAQVQAAADKQKEIMSKLKVEDLKVGTGEEVQNGDYLLMNYTGTLDDGTKFDSSYDHGQPLLFQFGVGQVIQGWDLGLAGMKVGGKRRLTIPPELGYGSQGNGPIPPDATLHFDVELVSIQRKIQ